MLLWSPGVSDAAVVSGGADRISTEPGTPDGTVPVELGRIGVWWSGSWRDPAEPDLERRRRARVARLRHAVVVRAASTPGSRRTSSACSPRRVTSRWPAASSASGRGHPRTSGRPWPTSRTAFPGRFLLGIGTSHGPVVADYTRALLEDGGLPRRARRARRRRCPPNGGSWLPSGPACSSWRPPAPPAPTRTSSRSSTRRRARDILGPGPLLAPEVAVVLETRPGPGAGSWPGSTPASTSACPTTRRTCAPSASATTTSTAAGATA